MKKKVPKDPFVYDGLKATFNLGEFDLAKKWTESLPKDFQKKLPLLTF